MDTEKLISALRDVLQAEKEEDEAREAGDGYDWDYYGQIWRERSEMCREAFEAALNEIIDARIRAILPPGPF